MSPNCSATVAPQLGDIEQQLSDIYHLHVVQLLRDSCATVGRHAGDKYRSTVAQCRPAVAQQLRYS